MSTPAFDHLVPGTPETEWRADPVLAGLPALQLPDRLRLLVVVAHPDDETLAMGGLVATAAAGGGAVEVVVATDGEGSHPDSPTTTPADLARTRRTEVRAAVARLAPAARVTLLGLPDGGLAGSGSALDQAVSDALHRLGGATGAWVASTWRGDAHPDHEAVGAAAARVCAAAGALHLEAPIWAWEWARPGDSRVPWARMRRLELRPAARAAKVAAMSEHASQTLPLSPAPGDEAVVPPYVVAHFERDDEAFVVTAHGEAEAADAASLDASYFEGLYAESHDPWRLTHGWYETRKRALLLASLPRERYRRVFEPGCALGLLTEPLADRCEELVAWDVAEAAVQRTAERLAGCAHVDVARGTVPAQWPDGRFDLVVLSEVGYYLGQDDLRLLVERLVDSLAPGGDLVLCHWRHDAPGYPVGADAVHDAVADAQGLVRRVHHEETDFLLDVWTRGDARSVAQVEGRVR